TPPPALSPLSLHDALPISPTAHLLDLTRGAVVLITAVKASEKTPRTTRRVRHGRMRAVVQPRVARLVPAIKVHYRWIRAPRVDVECGNVQRDPRTGFCASSHDNTRA